MQTLRIRNSFKLVHPFTTTLPDMVTPLPMSSGAYIIPGNQVRALNRRAQIDAIHAHVQRVPFTLFEHRLYRQGSLVGKKKDKQSEDEKAETSKYVNIARISALRAHDPHTSLNGSMALNISGKMAMSHISLVDAEPEWRAFVRGDDFVRKPEMVNMLSDADRSELERIAGDAATATRNKGRITELKQSIRTLDRNSDERAKVSEEIRSLEDQNKRIDPNILQPGLGYWCIPANTIGHQEVMLRQITADELAVFIAGQIRLGRYHRYGGHENALCGGVTFSGVISIEQASGGYEDIGFIRSIDPDDWCGGVVIECDHPLFNEARQAWERMTKTHFSDYAYANVRQSIENV